MILKSNAEELALMAQDIGAAIHGMEFIQCYSGARDIRVPAPSRKLFGDHNWLNISTPLFKIFNVVSVDRPIICNLQGVRIAAAEKQLGLLLEEKQAADKMYLMLKVIPLVNDLLFTVKVK